MLWAEASFRRRRQKQWDQMIATRADTHCQWVWVTINGSIAKTKQAAIAALMSSGIQAEEIWWNKAEFSIHRRQSGKIEQTKFIVRAIPNATVKELFVRMDSDLGCEVTCDENDQRTSTCKLWHFWAPAISFVKNCAWQMDSMAQIVAEFGSHREPNSMSHTARRWSTYTRRSRRDRLMVSNLPKVSTNSMDR